MHLYFYVGPADLLDDGRRAPGGSILSDRAALRRWCASEEAEVESACVVATYVVDEDGSFVVAARRSEHVSCARGRPVRAAGEVFFDGESVVAITNQSTGYCPDPDCWSAVVAALDAADIAHPTDFTTSFHFRRCEVCGERNVVKEGVFVCAICDADLPAAWNFG